VRITLKFRFSDFDIDVARHELRQGEELVQIEPQVFSLLVHLVQNRHRVVSKNEIIDVIWQGRVVSEAAISSRVSAARRAIGEDGQRVLDPDRLCFVHGLRLLRKIKVRMKSVATPALAIQRPAQSLGRVGVGFARLEQGEASR
jgi:hypothetical protein